MESSGNNGLLSIITPTYNHGSYIGDCIESVLAQTYRNWEMIIVDDGSTDETGDVVAGLKDPRIKYVLQENKGVLKLGETYNKALKMANGEFIAILEGDDYWPHYKLRLQVPDFEDEAVVLSFGSTAVVFDEHVDINPPKDLPGEAKSNTPVGVAGRYMMDYNVLTFTFPVSVVMRKAALDRIGGFQQTSYLPLVDYPTFLQLTLMGKFTFHNNICGFWRRHGLSTTKNSFPIILEGVYKYIETFLKEKGDHFKKEDRDWIRLNWSLFQSLRWSLLGRKLLHDAKWEDARKAFKQAQKYKPTLFRSLLIRAGVALSYLHKDMEFLCRWTGLKTVNVLLDKKDGDPIVSREMLEQK